MRSEIDKLMYYNQLKFDWFFAWIDNNKSFELINIFGITIFGNAIIERKEQYDICLNKNIIITLKKSKHKIESHDLDIKLIEWIKE